MTISNRYVPDSGPEDSPILFVGEAPGENEDEQLIPFVGASGDKLISCLGRNGLAREDVRLANLCHYRPFGNKFETLLTSTQLKNGIDELHKYIARTKPNVICAMGAYPLEYLTGKKGITRWRGSILPYVNDASIKVIPTFHPAYILRSPTDFPIFDFDIRRVIEDSKFREFKLPEREYVILEAGLEMEEWTQKLENAEILSVDIESVKKSTHILCVGFSADPKVGVCYPMGTTQAQQSIARLLSSRARKVFQFGTFDTIMLSLNGFNTENYSFDTLLAQHVMNPELPRSLGFLTSIYTRQPYYKSEGRGSIPGDVKSWSAKANRRELYEYNCKDVCVTLEIALEQEKEINSDPDWTRLFKFEMEQTELVKEMALAGLPVDLERREIIELLLLEKWQKKQFALDRLTGYETNVNSPKLKDILYDKLKFPPRRNRDAGLTTDEDAIVSLITYCKSHLETLKRPDAILDWQVKSAILSTILEIRGIRKLLSTYIKAKIFEPTGRLHSTPKIGGTETARYSFSQFVDKSGLNAQTFPREVLEVSDDFIAYAQQHRINLSELSKAAEIDALKEQNLDEENEGE